jgi:hypothetical protein
MVQSFGDIKTDIKHTPQRGQQLSLTIPPYPRGVDSCLSGGTCERAACVYVYEPFDGIRVAADRFSPDKVRKRRDSTSSAVVTALTLSCAGNVDSSSSLRSFFSMHLRMSCSVTPRLRSASLISFTEHPGFPSGPARLSQAQSRITLVHWREDKKKHRSSSAAETYIRTVVHDRFALASNLFGNACACSVCVYQQSLREGRRPCAAARGRSLIGAFPCAAHAPPDPHDMSC